MVPEERKRMQREDELSDPLLWNDLELFRGLTQTSRIRAHIRRDGLMISPTPYAAAIFRRLTGSSDVPRTVFGWNRGVMRAVRKTREIEGLLDSFWGIQSYISVKCLLLHPTVAAKGFFWREHDTTVRKVCGRWEPLRGVEPDVGNPMAFLMNHVSDARRAVLVWLFLVQLNPRVLANWFWFVVTLAFMTPYIRREKQRYARETADVASAAPVYDKRIA
jgi:hypothetical protein